jgi:hypothetical protein
MYRDALCEVMELGILTINYLRTSRLSGKLDEEAHPHALAIRGLGEQLAVSTFSPSSSIHLYLLRHLIEFSTSKIASFFGIIAVQF